MGTQIRYNERSFPLDITADTVLHALQGLDIPFPAPCGGAGTCGKCSVWIRDEAGTRLALACQTKPAPGMDVFVETPQPLTIAETGIEQPFPCDCDASGFGLATDIGTTTVVMRLYDLARGTLLASASLPNPQAVFGADVIARISACQEGRMTKLERCIVDEIGKLARSLCDKAGIALEDVTRSVVAGNTVMESIAAGVSPEPIGVSPFIPLDMFGHDVDLPGLPVPTHMTACLSGYVGGDITADLVACGLAVRGDTTLLLDLGTNGEMALGNAQHLLTCATAAGPVFEGANICFGMPARTGAISHVRLAGDDLAIETIGDAPAFGICGTGIIDAVAVLLDAGIVDETGYLCDADEVPGLSEALSARIGDSPDGRGLAVRLAEGICLTQSDVRNVQLAKAAVCAGVHTMLEAAGVTEADVDRLLIAGGFGTFLNLESAARIGLFPASLVDRAQSIGNAAIEGASALLLSAQARSNVDDIVRLNDYIELSASATFNRHYVDCMGF